MSLPGAYYNGDTDEDPTGLDDSDADADFLPDEDEIEMDAAEAEVDEDGEDVEEMRIGTDAQNRLFLVRGDGTQIPLDIDSLRANGHLGLLQQLLAGNRGGGGRGNRAASNDVVTDDGDSDYEDEDDAGGGGLFGGLLGGGHRAAPKPIYPIVHEPIEAGMNLERSGEFGPLPKHKYSNRKALINSTNVADNVRRHALAPPSIRTSRPDVADAILPNSVGTVVARFDANPYIGTWSSDGSFFYCASQDFRVRIFTSHVPDGKRTKGTTDTTPRRMPTGRFGYARQDERSSLRLVKSIYAHDAYSRWTITDANLSPSNDALIYSSIGSVVNMVRTREGAYSVEGFGDDASDHVQLNFGNGRSNFGIWSIRFSADAREIIAGASSGSIFAYDVERRMTTLRVAAHDDDVNAVAFADEASSNILVSGSDDALIKVWDRRSLRGQKPSGVLPGHTEGLTYLSAKGDGRYVVSNGKDQTAKLWDLRKLVSPETLERSVPRNVGVPGWDYRASRVYSKPRYAKHPNDASVMTYTGHTVLSTLIRCHFSPAQQSGQRYIYSGSADSRVHIWSLDGTIKQILDRRNTLPMDDPQSGLPNDVFAAPMASSKINSDGWGQVSCTVRDVSWHPFEPTLISSSWDRGRHGDHGSLIMHRWTGAR